MGRYIPFPLWQYPSIKAKCGEFHHLFNQLSPQTQKVEERDSRDGQRCGVSRGWVKWGEERIETKWGGGTKNKPADSAPILLVDYALSIYSIKHT